VSKSTDSIGIAYSYSYLLLQAGPVEHGVFFFSDAIVPALVIILVDASDQAVVIDLDEHENMAPEVFATSLHGHIAIWSNNVVATSANPDLFQHCSFRCWNDVLACQFRRSSWWP
jgi:hypothetical protein